MALNKETLMYMKSLPLLLLLPCFGCVYTRCGCFIEMIDTNCADHVDTMASQSKLVKVHGTFTSMKRSWIFDEGRRIEDGEFLIELIKRMPVYLLTLPLQLMIYEDKADVPTDCLIDLGPGSWGCVHVFRLPEPYLRSCNKRRYRVGKERKICDFMTPNGEKAELWVKSDADLYSSGDLFLRIVAQNRIVTEKKIFSKIFYDWYSGWLLVDDSGVVAYVKDCNYHHECSLKRKVKSFNSTVAYRLNWQSVEFEPVVELGYGELVSCNDVR